MEHAKGIVIPFRQAARSRRRHDLAMALALLNKAVRVRRLAAARANSLQLLRIAAQQIENAKSLGA
jgi:hypothetical protein